VSVTTAQRAGQSSGVLRSPSMGKRPRVTFV